MKIILNIDEKSGAVTAEVKRGPGRPPKVAKVEEESDDEDEEDAEEAPAAKKKPAKKAVAKKVKAKVEDEDDGEELNDDEDDDEEEESDDDEESEDDGDDEEEYATGEDLKKIRQALTAHKKAHGGKPAATLKVLRQFGPSSEKIPVSKVKALLKALKV